MNAAALEITLQMVLAVIAGIGAQVLADYLKVPSIVFLLLFGILLGADGMGWLHPNLLGVGLEVIVSLSVALILFEGGLNLQLRDLSRVSVSLRNLVSFGVLITFPPSAPAKLRETHRLGHSEHRDLNAVRHRLTQLDRPP
ncbi:cation:proton antiporter [Leptolyngbya sp. 7M]|uniref:cation:proton antiporter domain-containing protein n=1 Tax=Leptolyngbya sp. 7M TaxID=2812896 RepID=UPI001B8D0576|nr:cation:proton antiporter [Leptolyngbya sp. 7M]QYO64501.1 cation:proton antiporter [Leptolyngbya sp. 7M]